MTTYYINKSSLKQVDDLQYGYVFKIVAIISLLISFSLCIGIILFETPKEHMIYSHYGLILLSLAYFLFSIYITMDCFTTYLKYDKEKIVFYSMWNGKRELLWNDLTKIEFSENFKWYILTFNNKNKIRLSLYLVGITPMVQHLESLGLELEFT